MAHVSAKRTCQLRVAVAEPAAIALIPSLACYKAIFVLKDNGGHSVPALVLEIKNNITYTSVKILAVYIFFFLRARVVGR